MGWGYGSGYDTETTTTVEEFLAKQRADGERKVWKSMGIAGDVGKDLAQLLRGMDAIAPSKQEQRAIAQCLRDGVSINFLSIVCPDYSTAQEGDNVRYTFDALGDGIGIVAGRALDVSCRLAQFFAERNITHQASFILAMADQEANEENCRRVGLDRSGFLAKLRGSLKAIANQAEALGVKVETPLLTELDRDRWEASRRDAKGHLSRVSQGLFSAACRTRHLFYERWAGRGLRDDEVRAMLMAQAEEYVAVGRYMSAEGRVIIGLDAPVMAPFVRHGANGTPVIYFRRPEY